MLEREHRRIVYVLRHLRPPCTLALEDGRVFKGRSIGAPGQRTGEVVFNTGMTGYREILTDPSYRGQIVAMTSPLIGNCGTNEEDGESAAPQAEGFVVRESSRTPSNWRSAAALPELLNKHGEFHPEAGPGPQDAGGLFQRFVRMMRGDAR